MLINILDLSFIWTSFSFFGGSIVFKDTYIGIWNMIQMLIISTINLITFTYIIIKFFKNINIYLKYENKDETNL